MSGTSPDTAVTKEQALMNGKRSVAVAAATVALALVFSACGKSSSPMSPSSSSSLSAAPAGATINGTVVTTASGSASGYAKLAAGTITVTIVGTGITVTTDNQGNFVLTGVPAGTIQLVITSSAGSATVTLNGVQETDRIKIQIKLQNGTATLESEQRNGTDVTELEDRITSIPATARTLVVGTTLVSVPATVVPRHGQTEIAFTDLKVGDRVHVRGTMSGTTMTATELVVQNTNEKVPVNVSGKVSNLVLGSGCPSIRFDVAGYTVETNASTSFQKGACSDIAAQTTVHVKGDVQASGRVLADWVQVTK